MPNLDKIHYKFFPKSQTASTGTKLIYFAWAIEITVAIVGLSIAYLFYFQKQSVHSPCRLDNRAEHCMASS